jgi:acyl carrier protein
MLNESALLQFIEERLGVEAGAADASTLLFSSGLIDSAGMVELVAYVESVAGVRFAPEDITLDNLDSIAAILAFVAAANGA